MKDLFISYSTKDADLVAAFLKDFGSSGITHWIDIENLYKEAGHEFGEVIKQNIQESQAFLLFYTPNSIQSDYVKLELEYAVSQDKTILCFPFFPNSTEFYYNRHREFSDYLNKVQWLCNAQQVQRIPGLVEYLQGDERLRDLSALIQDSDRREDSRFANDVILARIGIQRFLKKPLTPFGTFSSFANNNEIYQEHQIRFNVLNTSFYVFPTEGTADRIQPFLDKAEKWHPTLAKYNQGYDIDDKSLYNKMLKFIIEKCKTDEQGANAIIEEAKLLAIDVIAKEMKGNELMFNGPMVGVYNIKSDRIPGCEDGELEVLLYQSDYFTFKFTGELYHLLKQKGVAFDINYANVTDYAPFLCSLGLGGFIIVKQGLDEYLLWTKRSSMIQAKNMWHFSYDETVHLLNDLILDNNGNPIRTNEGYMVLAQQKMFERALKEELRLHNKVSDDYKKGIFEIGLIECDRLEVELFSYVVMGADSSTDIEWQFKKYTDTAKDKIEWSKITYVPFSMDDIKKEFHGKFLTPESLALAEHLLIQKEENNLY